MFARTSLSTVSKRSFAILACGLILLAGCCPIITNFNPETGISGIEVTIEGKHFEDTPGDNTVKFSGITVSTADIPFASTTKIKAKVPAGAQTGRISVKNRYCTGYSPRDFEVGTPSSKPDLVPKSLFFDSDSILHVSFKNEGEGEVPANRGHLAIYIDGRPVEDYPFSSLTDQSFRAPGGSLTIRTNSRMSGTNRRIAVSVDSDNEIDESNEFQNTLSRTITPPVNTGADLILSDLTLGSNQELRIVVKNTGSANSPPNLSVRMRVVVNENLVRDFTTNLPFLAAGGGPTLVSPGPPIIISSSSKVRVLLDTPGLLDEIDNTNNVREEILPHGPSTTPYVELLAVPKIRNNIIWHGRQGTEPLVIQSYSSWTESQKADLDHMILAFERGEPHPLSAPPTLVSDTYLSVDDAWKIYLAHIAQSLWVEVHGTVSWHLADFSEDQLAYLLDSRHLMVYWVAYNGMYSFSPRIMGNLTAWNPRICYEFLVNLRMIKSSQLETIDALTDWMRGHLIHLAADENYTQQFGYAGPPPADKVLYPLEGRLHKTAGCWGTSGLYGAVLRSVNIPVERADINLMNQTHCRPVFPSVDKGMPHGDDPYTAILVPSGAVISSSELFYSLSQMAARFVNPTVDCVGSTCNTPGEQADYNSGKDQWQLAYDTMADYILYEYAQYGPGYLNDSLRGPRMGGGVHEFVKPYFSNAERAIMVAAVGIKIREIGRGDIEAGKRKVIDRWNRFGQNR